MIRRCSLPVLLALLVAVRCFSGVAQVRADDGIDGWYTVTAYCERGLTASGTYAGPGAIAGPAWLPFGTALEIDDGAYVGTVQDRGGPRIQAGWLDLWLDCAAARAWGVRRVRVRRISVWTPAQPPDVETVMVVDAGSGG